MTVWLSARVSDTVPPSGVPPPLGPSHIARGPQPVPAHAGAPKSKTIGQPISLSGARRCVCAAPVDLFGPGMQFGGEAGRCMTSGGCKGAICSQNKPVVHTSLFIMRRCTTPALHPISSDCRFGCTFASKSRCFCSSGFSNTTKVPREARNSTSTHQGQGVEQLRFDPKVKTADACMLCGLLDTQCRSSSPKRGLDLFFFANFYAIEH